MLHPMFCYDRYIVLMLSMRCPVVSSELEMKSVFGKSEKISKMVWCLKLVVIGNTLVSYVSCNRHGF